MVMLTLVGVGVFIKVRYRNDGAPPEEAGKLPATLERTSVEPLTNAMQSHITALSRPGTDPAIDRRTWDLVKSRILLVGTDRQSGALTEELVELLGITADERHRIDSVTSDVLDSLKRLESTNASLVSNGDDEMIMIESFDGTAVRQVLSEKFSDILRSERASMLMDVFDRAPCMREYGKYPTTIYFEGDSSGNLKFKVEETRTMLIDAVTTRVSERLNFAPATTISEKTTVSPNSAHYHRYSHVVESVTGP